MAATTAVALCLAKLLHLNPFRVIPLPLAWDGRP